MPENERTQSSGRENKKYPALTAAQQRQVRLGYCWRYVYPGLMLVAILVLPYETALVAGIGMIPYAAATWLLSLRPSPALVFSLQGSRHEPLHEPETEEEIKKYRVDGKILAVFLLVLAAVFFVLWIVRKNKAM